MKDFLGYLMLFVAAVTAGYFTAGFYKCWHDDRYLFVKLIPWKWRYALRDRIPSDWVWEWKGWSMWAAVRTSFLKKAWSMDVVVRKPLDLPQFVIHSVTSRILDREESLRGSLPAILKAIRLLRGSCMVTIESSGFRILSAPLGVFGQDEYGRPYPLVFTAESGKSLVVRFQVPNQKARKALASLKTPLDVQVMLNGVLRQPRT